MTKRQRIRWEVAFTKRTIVLGAARTSALTALKNKHDISEGMLRAACLHVPGCGYWT